MLIRAKACFGLSVVIPWAVSAILLAPGSAVADPEFLNVADSANLNFVGSYADTFYFEVMPWRKELMQRNMGCGAAVGDYDNDGDLDIYLLAQLGLPNKLYRNDVVAPPNDGFGDSIGGGFVDVTDSAGVGNMGFSRVAHFVDLDNDGFLDLVLVNDNDVSGNYPGSRIYRNTGTGSFHDVTLGSNFETEPGLLRCGCALADFDQDGLLDIYVTNWSFRGSGTTSLFPGMNRLYRNLGGFHFEDVTNSVGLGALDRDSFSAIFTDFSFDAFPDLYVAVDHTSDEFYPNDSGQFVNATLELGTTHLGNDMGAACADFDDDGDLDIYATNITSSDGFGFGNYNVFYVFDAATRTFNDEAVLRGVQDTYWGWGAEFVDVENNGSLDIVAVNGFQEFLFEHNGEGSDVWETPTVLFLNDGTGNYTRFYAGGLEDPDDSRALIAFDYDRDGDQDLLITNVEQPVRLLKNVSAPSGHWLDLALVQGDGNNRNAIGATVTATVGHRTMRRDIICGESYLAGNPAEIHFGLGDAAVVDRLRIRWTDGTESAFDNVAADRFVTISNILGDCTADTRTDGDDVAGIVAVMLGDPDAPLCLTDANGDAVIDGTDIQLLVSALLSD
ncbi:MAG: CRTAC1 family protein [Planctomycetota bacterium]|nr:CRTAC1 family protein [Planctomycetota bacterium]